MCRVSVVVLLRRLSTMFFVRWPVKLKAFENSRVTPDNDDAPILVKYISRLFG